MTEAPNNALYEKLIVHDFAEATATGYGIRVSNTAGPWSFTLRNCIVYNGDRSGIHIDEAVSSITVDNCTVYNMEGSGVVVGSGGGIATVTNTISMDNGTASFVATGGILIQSYNMSSDGTVAGTGSLTLESSANEFVSLTPGSEDLHLSGTANALDVGKNLSASFTDDIDGDSRSFQLWDMGADEASGGAACSPQVNLRSIGTNGATLDSGPDASITAGMTTVTFGASLLPNIGPGDKLDINGEIFYILSRVSDTEVTVQTSGGGHASEPYTITRAYNTLQSWEDACGATPCLPLSAGGRGGDLVADNRLEVGVAYNDGDFTAGVVIDGSITDDCHYMRLTVAPGQRHDGTAGTGVVLDGQDQPDRKIDVRDDYTIVEWFELKRHGGAAFTEAVRSQAANVLLTHLIIYDFNDVADIDGIDPGGSTNLTVRNCIIYDGTNDGISGGDAGDTVTTENCTIYGMGDDGISEAPSTFTVRNTLSMGNTGSDFDMVVGTQSYNLSSDGTASGAGSLTGKDPTLQFVNITPLDEANWDLHLIPGADAIDAGTDLSASFFSDIDGELRVTPWDIGADDFDATTAVELSSFEAAALDGAVELSWETGSELNNLGFQLYRSSTEEGSYERITDTVIPGLGSSPEGAKYAYRDSGLTNGVTYFYQLEDIETTGRTELHGPVSATPQAGASSSGGVSRDGSSDSGSNGDISLITYGDPSANTLRVLKRSRRHVVLELLTEGFYAEPQDDGTVRITIPDFAELAEAGSPLVPVRRSWVEAIAGRKVKLVSVAARGVEAFTSLRPSDADMPEIVATRDGTVRAARRRSRRSVRRRESAAFQGGGLYPSEAARVVSVGFQGEVKKALVELAPLRWDGTRGQLLLARRLVVRLSFRARDPAEHSTDGVRGRRYGRPRSHDSGPVVARLLTTERGLHAVRYEEVLRSRRGVRARALRLSRQGETLAFHLEPSSRRFKPGSTLYFMSEGASANPYGSEAVYELEVGHSGEAGASMPEISAAPSGEPTRFYWHRAEWEVNRYYQAALLEAPDLWLWDLLFAPVVKSYPIEVSALVPNSEASKLSVWLQGVSDFQANPDHHVRVYVNGSLVEELSWNGKQAQHVDVELAPGLLREGDNVLELENVGDTEAAYSMVMLDRYAVEYPRVALAGDGRLRGRWSESGTAELSGLVAGAHVLDMSGAQASWLLDTELGADGMLRFRAESGRSYLAVSPEAVYHPAVTKPRASHLKNVRNRADYLVIGPEAFLRAAIPLLELRQRQGLKVKAVSIEEVYSEFGFGESAPEAVKDFLSYAYHNWRQPSPRYVLLLGDATFDFKDHLQTGVTNQVPPRMVKTSYLWTASDPSYAAVNGEDILPDFSIGRLPAATVEQVQAMVEKILAYETGEAGLDRSAVVLVADNPDRAGNFEADADELAATVLASKNPEKIYLSQLGTAATRNAIVQSFDAGASLVSYLGHGGIHLWADENFFNASNVASLAPQPQQPLLLTMNCLNGYFHFPYFNSLAEELVHAKDKGAIAAFSPSGLSLNGPANLYHKALLQELFNGRHGRLGDAVLAAQVAYAGTGAFPELLTIYHLLGDPALTLR